MNAPRTPNPLTRKEGLAIWLLEDLHIIYDETRHLWYQRQLDIDKEHKALPISTTLADKFLAFYNLSTARLLNTLEN